MNTTILAVPGDILIGVGAVIAMILALLIWVIVADKARLKSNKKDRKGKWIKEGDNLSIMVLEEGKFGTCKARVFKDFYDDGKFKLRLFGKDEKVPDQIVLLDDFRSDQLEIIV